MNYENFATGSIFSSLSKEDSLPLAGLFLCASGSIRTMIGTPPSSSQIETEEHESALSVLSYLLYALDNSKWIKQYHDEEIRLIRELESENKALESRQRRSHLHVLQGGMSKGDKHE